MVPPEDPIPVFVEYDGATKRHRTRKWFPNGLDREAKDFFLRLAREGKRPAVVLADVVRPTVFVAEEVPAPRPAKKLKQGELFNTAPDQLPD